ncbi:DEAD/DEAH box helicase family protein [Gammaproteobacteria bacterium]|nr:DEAD/DEAH box helicase family protein [Gammaproteobacteria bacterium]
MELKRIDRLISGSKSWNDLYQELSTNKQFTQKFKGDVFERVTQAYLLTLPEYKSKLDKVWLNEEIPQQVLKKLNLPPTDFGIDLVAKTKSNEYWTIQCKFKSTKNALTYKELSTFSSLSFVTAKHISLAIVAHTSTKPIRNRQFLGKVTEIGSGAWRNISEDEWENIRKTCSHKAIRLVKRKPRPHQRQAIKDSKRHFLKNKESRGKLIMPCATGKSLAAFWIAESLEAKKIIVAVPSLSLIKQSLNDWTKEYLANGVVPEWLCVCSDESTGKVDIDEFNTDTYDLGIPTTTKKQEIVKFLKQRTLSPKIIFTTYQSSPLLATAAKEARTNFDLAILDEAHKTVGVKSKTFSTLLFEEKIKVKKRLFMTATERVLRGKNDEVASMDDPSIYGGSVYTMTFKDAIEQNIISDYKILTIAVSDSEVSNLIEDNRYISSDIDKSNESSAQYLASGIALKKTYKKYKIKHAISFHRSIALAKQFQAQQDELNKVQSLRPKVENLHISSKKSAGERVELIKEFTQFDRSLITNARCLTEGVDVPAIDCVMFVDPKQSTIDIVQAAGRALRKYEEKEFGYILLPIVVPDGMDVEDFADTTAFRNITKIIAALSTQDERIAEEFRLEKNSRSSKGKIINIDAKLKLGKKIDIAKFSLAIETRIWERVAKVNWRPFEDARNHVRGLNLKGQSYYWDLHKQGGIPLDIPYKPEDVYKGQGWNGYGDWCGTGNIATQERVYRPYKEASAYAKKLGIKSQKEWMNLSKEGKLPSDIPSKPERVYKGKGWIDLSNFLGTGFVATQDRKYLEYNEAKKIVKKLNISTKQAWFDYTKTGELPDNIPASPDQTYSRKGKWITWGDWLGTGRKQTQQREYLPYDEAKIFVHKLNFTNEKQYYEYAKSGNLPENIPNSPRNVYKGKGWNGMVDWLGKKK